MDVKSTDWTRLRPKALVDRKEELNEIKGAFGKGSEVVYLLGKGGIGKTRILEELCSQEEDFIPIGIFDVYHPKYHKVSGIEQAIVGKVREKLGKDVFENYARERKIYEEARKKGMVALSLEELRRKMDEAFWKDLESAAALFEGKHVVFCFDTMELLFHEVDEVEKLLGGERPRGLELADWLKDALTQEIPNLHFLLAGRPEKDWWKTLSKTKGGTEINLGPLDESGVGEYLESIGMGGEDPSTVFGWTRGEPLRLVFVTILREAGRTLPTPPVPDKEIDETLIEEIMNLTDDMSVALPYIAFLSKGVTPEILSRAMKPAWGDEWNEEKSEEFLSWFRNMPFVKIRPSDDRIFLHDEMYRVMREYVLSKMTDGMKDAADEVVAYYRENPDLPRSEMIYYLLYRSWKEGFDEYRKLSDEAIAEHRTGDDLLLRDEVLRFINDYDYKNLLPQVDKDAIIRWLKRLLAMGEYESAKRLAESIREHGLLDSLTEEERQVFSVYEAEAKIYTGYIDDGLMLLEKSKEVLKPDEKFEPTSYEDRRRVQAYIRALNDIGYASARGLDFWKASKFYGEALHGYNSLLTLASKERLRSSWEEKVSNVESLYGESTLSDWADTLKNLAFVYSKLGFPRAAYRLATESGRMYHWVQNEYGMGLTMSTLGAIFIEREWYCNARRVLENALKVFDETGVVPDERGRGLVLLSLGQVLRKLVDMENIHGREAEFEKLLEESERYLHEALYILERKEPARLPGAYQALGCLYRDRLAFAVRAGECEECGKERNGYRRESKKWFRLAFRTAMRDLQKADIYVDQAGLEYHYRYQPGYGVVFDPEERDTLEKLLKEAERRVPKQFRHPYCLPPPPEEQKNTTWWKVMGKIHLLKGHVAFKAGDFEEAIEEYLESFLFFDLYSEEVALFSVASRSGRRLYSKFSRIPEEELIKMENLLLEKGAKRRILDRQGWRSLLSLVQDARLRAEPYVL